MIADDHPLMLDALAGLVASAEGLGVVARCGDGEGALAAIRELAPDVALIDVWLPGRDGPAVASAVRRARLTTRILFLSGRDDPVTLHRCVAAGAHGFVTKSASHECILGAIEAVASGREAFGAHRVATARGRELAERGDVLTPRERNVLALSADGLSTAAIAEELYIAPTTVKTHLRQAAAKLGVRGKTAASATALRQGLIR